MCTNTNAVFWLHSKREIAASGNPGGGSDGCGIKYRTLSLGCIPNRVDGTKPRPERMFQKCPGIPTESFLQGHNVPNDAKSLAIGKKCSYNSKLRRKTVEKQGNIQRGESYEQCTAAAAGKLS